MTAHIRRIEAVEKDLKALSGISASKDDLSRLRAEVKKLYDGLNIGRPSKLSVVTKTYTFFFKNS